MVLTPNTGGSLSNKSRFMDCASASRILPIREMNIHQGRLAAIQRDMDLPAPRSIRHED